MSTYVRALSPAKTVAGSDTSLLSRRSRNLWERGRKQSGLHSFTIAAPLRVRQPDGACTRVSVRVRAYLKKQPRQSSTLTTTVIDMQMQGICI
jgi:hypothetical protein